MMEFCQCHYINHPLFTFVMLGGIVFLDFLLSGFGILSPLKVGSVGSLVRLINKQADQCLSLEGRIH